jgi:hypothetical protein
MDGWIHHNHNCATQLVGIDFGAWVMMVCRRVVMKVLTPRKQICMIVGTGYTHGYGEASPKFRLVSLLRKNSVCH